MEDDKDAGVLRIVIDQGPVQLTLLVILPTLLLLQHLKGQQKFFREETTFLVSIAGSVAKPRALTWWIRPCTEPSVVRTKIRSEDETGKEELWALKRRHQYYFFKITFGFVFTLRKQIQQAVLAYDAEEWDENCPPDEIHAYQAHFSFKSSSPLPHGL